MDWWGKLAITLVILAVVLVVQQAALALNMWTGEDVPLDVMRGASSTVRAPDS